MTDNIDINIEIEGHRYSLTIPRRDEMHWRQAGKHIQNRIHTYRREHKVLANQEIMTRICLEMTSGLLIERSSNLELTENLSTKISRIQAHLDQQLSE